MNSTISEILKKWLESNGYDGLFTLGCQCNNNELMTCGQPIGVIEDCEAGYKIKCPGYCDISEDDSPHSHIVREKENRDT